MFRVRRSLPVLLQIHRTMATQGFGCMGFSAFYSSANKTKPEKAKAVIELAVSKDVKLLNTATFYGPLNEEGFGANLRLLKEAISGIDRSKIQLMVKICMDTRCPIEKTGTSWVLRVSPKEVMQDVDYALEQLGTDYLDVIVLCRIPHDIPIEEVVNSMKAVVDSGKARHIGLSEASARTIRRAHAVYPLYCIEQEWSLWARDIEADIVPTCRELGIKIVAYSPLGKGFLTGTIRSLSSPALEGADYRKTNPKVVDGNLEKNLALVDAVQKVADAKKCTMGQLALAWLHAQGSDVIPIPGTTSVAHLEENLAARDIVLTSNDLQEIEEIFRVDAPVGERYPGNHMTFHEN